MAIWPSDRAVRLTGSMIRLFRLGWWLLRDGRRSRRAVFSDIYANNDWGEGTGPFHSGYGSDPANVTSYVQYVCDYVRAHQINRIVDLGCGDFRVGAQIVARCNAEYIGADIVVKLIDFNQHAHGSPRVSFKVVDLVDDELPDGDLYLLRQVLQHLSNAEISSVLSKLRDRTHVLVTEHFPPISRKFIANIDKPHGAGIRTVFGSAIVIQESPFNIAEAIEVLNNPIVSAKADEGDTLRTFLFGKGSTATRNQ